MTLLCNAIAEVGSTKLNLAITACMSNWSCKPSSSAMALLNFILKKKLEKNLTEKLPILNEMELNPIISMATLSCMSVAEISELVTQSLSSLNEADFYMSQYQLLSITGPQDFACEMQSKALERSAVYKIAGTKQPVIRLLALMGPGNITENTPLDYLVMNSDIELYLLYIVPDSPLPTNIPEHDIAIIGLCMSEKTKPLLDLFDKLIKQWPRPVLNLPNRIQRCYRDSLCLLLESIPRLIIPPTVKISRAELERIARLGLSANQLFKDGNFPLTVRPLDFHSGIGFCKVDNTRDLFNYLEVTEGQEFFVSFFIDYSSADGLFRKARIALIEGLPYICHWAISEHWIVHYKSASMGESIAKREEEESFMRNFDTEFALRHRDALLSIAERLDIDYAVIDCAETPDGNLLIFEIDNVGWVHATDPVDIFPYKQDQMSKVFAAFRAMLVKAIKETG